MYPVQPHSPTSQARANELYALAEAERRHSNHHAADTYTVQAAMIEHALRLEASWREALAHAS